MAQGKQVCNLLNAIRRKIAEANYIGKAAAIAGSAAGMMAISGCGSASNLSGYDKCTQQGESLKLPHAVADDISETQPEFPGGMEAMMLFISENFKYPQTCDDFQGRIIARFMIDKSGNVCNPAITESDLPERYNKEVLRVIKLMPTFHPGERNGIPADMWQTIAIRFRIQDDNN